MGKPARRTTKSESAWVQNRRRDGLKVHYDNRMDAWDIVDADGKRLVTRCPCCTRPMRSARVAMAVADTTLPLRQEAAAETQPPEPEGKAERDAP